MSFRKIFTALTLLVPNFMISPVPSEIVTTGQRNSKQQWKLPQLWLGGNHQYL